jgi:cystathionine beta-lyase/cystathionine gamma-synthase
MISNFEYLHDLVQGTLAEVDHSLDHNQKLIATKLKLVELAESLSDNDHDWFEQLAKYTLLDKERAILLNEVSALARTYGNMEDFWLDADLQKQGKSRYTFWDTYEHGRRRQLESMLADSYGSEQALLLNAGMSALQVGVEVSNLREGDEILTTDRGFFETTEFLEEFVAPRGVHIIRVPSTEITTALQHYRPKLLVTETTINVFQAECMKNFDKWQDASPSTIYLIDNSVQSHLTKLFQQGPKNLLVVESGTKYVTEEVSVGILYGNGHLIEKARSYARGIGQQLQEKCFNYLSEGALKSLEKKLKLHSRNVELFSNTILETCLDELEFYHTLNHQDPSSHLFTEGQGSIIYLKVKDNGTIPDKQKRVLMEWKKASQECSVDFQIKAGFGWNRTISSV